MGLGWVVAPPVLRVGTLLVPVSAEIVSGSESVSRGPTDKSPPCETTAGDGNDGPPPWSTRLSVSVPGPPPRSSRPRVTTGEG